MEKKCFKCGIIKPLDNFYKHSAMKDGRVNKCILCNKSDVSDNYIKNKDNPEYIERERERGREKYYRLSYLEKYKEKHKDKNYSNTKLNRARFPEKAYCRTLVFRSKINRLIDNSQFHHWSYNKKNALDVIELSIKDHNKAHRFIVYDSERYMYRRCDNMELLDTKELHLDYITHCILNK